MNVQDVRAFFEFRYWATDKLLQEYTKLTSALRLNSAEEQRCEKLCLEF
jgi:hypothetical protein